MINSKFRTILLAGAATLVLSATATAQPTPSTPTAEKDKVEKVTVTARRRSEALKDVPVAVTSVSGEKLEAQGAQDITALSQSTPNVTFETSRATNSTLTAFIRGVGQQDPVAGFEQGVGLYLDDVYLNRPQGSVLNIYDVERIEILRGPQGTLYGRNTIGGAIKYVTRRLDPNEPMLRAKLSYGSYNQLDAVVVGSQPLSDTFRVGAAVASLNRDGFGSNLFTGVDNYNKEVLAGRFSAEWEPSANFLVRLGLDHSQDDSNARQGYRLLPTASAGQPFLLSDSYDTTAGIGNFGAIRENKQVNSGGHLLIDWSPAEHWTLKSITAYRKDNGDAPIDFDSTPLRNFDVPAVYKNKQFSQEVQAVYEGERLTFVAGGYYLNANAFDAFDVIFGASGVSTFTLGDVDTKTWAIFGEATYALTDSLSLTLGGRYTEDERSVHIQKNTYLGLGSPYFGNAAAVNLTATTIVDGQEVVPNFRGTRQDEAFTPRIILAWEPNQDLNLYASYSQGFKGGGFDPRGNFGNADVRKGFLPESVDSYEVGAKAILFGGRATANTAVFFAQYSDVQIPGSAIVLGPPVSFVGTVTNAGAAEFKGIEFEGTALFDEHWTGFLSIGYIDAEYTEFVVNGVNVASQRAVQNTPDLTSNASLTYATPLSLGSLVGTLTFTGTASYRGATQQFETAIPLLDSPSYWLYDAAINWTSENDRWRFGIYGRNLSDERYITSGYNFPGAATDNSVLAFYGNPRTVTATIGYRF